MKKKKKQWFGLGRLSVYRINTVKEEINTNMTLNKLMFYLYSLLLLFSLINVSFVKVAVNI